MCNSPRAWIASETDSYLGRPFSNAIDIRSFKLHGCELCFAVPVLTSFDDRSHPSRPQRCEIAKISYLVKHTGIAQWPKLATS